MKKKILISCLLLLFCLPAFAEKPLGSMQQGKTPQGKATADDTETWIDANKLLMFVTNSGGFANQAANTLGKSDGLYFPFTTVDAILDGSNDNTVIFASGLWVGAIDNSVAPAETLTVIAEFSNEFFPGPMNGDTITIDADILPEYRVYKLYKDSLKNNPGGDYNDYMTYAVAQGAPVDVNGEPDILGDQFLWTVYNDAEPSFKTNSSSQTAPLGIEVRQSTFAFDREDALGQVVFLRFRIYNYGGKQLDSMFIALWSDPDLGGASDDLVGCDTLLNIGYVYNATNNDNNYGSTPPCAGYDFFQGPLIPSIGDTAKMWGTTWPDFTNMPMTSFAKYINGQEPQNAQQSYQFMEGLIGSQGGVALPNGTKYFAPGDPVTKTGDLDFAPDDRRFMVTTGPIDFAPGDSTEIIAAIVVARGSDRLSSITAMRFFDKSAQEAFDNDFVVPQAAAAPVVTLNELDGFIALEWTDISETDPGDYSFEGYTILQGETQSGPWTRVANYDVINDVTLVSELAFDESVGLALIKPTKFGSDNGIKRYFGTAEDAINGGTLNNGTEYYFRVEAYSYLPILDPITSEIIEERTLTSAVVITAIPQQPPAGTDLPYLFFDSIAVTHIGGSGGLVFPEVLSPNQLNGHTYQVTFIDTFVTLDTILTPNPIFPADSVDTAIITVEALWNLDDLTTGQRLLSNQTNQTGDPLWDYGGYEQIDGFFLRVEGPPAGFLSFQVVANAAGPIDPPVAGAFDFRGFPTPGGTNPPDEQQVGDGHWAFHTGDNGGSNDGGDRGPYSKFIERALRNDNADDVGKFDFEMRFTGDPATQTGGSTAIRWFQDDLAMWVPFEIWRIGVGTPNDPSDDVRMTPWDLDFGDDTLYNLESWGSSANGGGPGGFEHSASGGDNDPYTDWIYWALPNDDSPGQSGYLADEAAILAGTYGGGEEVMARTVLINWNGGSAPPFTQDLPEQGTVFRLLTAKPSTSADTFTFVATAQSIATAGNEVDMERIRAVPNPYYLASSYDNSVIERRMKFTNLPPECTIKIFTLSGDLVATVEHNDMVTSWEEWNVESTTGIPLASGIYIYVVEAPGFGQKIGKMAIFTEEEQLNTF